MTREEFFKDKIILITGGTGTIGRKLTSELLKYKPKQIRIFSRSESRQAQMIEDFGYNYGDDPLRFLIGNIRDKERLHDAMKNVDYVFHCAGMKRVESCEHNPTEAKKINVDGTENVMDVAFENGVKRVVFTSTDKASSPINVMGATKLLSEKHTSAIHRLKGTHDTICCSVRFGNVLGSTGSAVPLFVNQIKNDKEVTVTKPEITRFIMTSQHAVDLIITSMMNAYGGEIFILKMPVIILSDLIRAIHFHYNNNNDVNMKIIGMRPGEKDYELLYSEEEAKFIVETDDMFILLPEILNGKLKNNYNGLPNVEIEAYSSQNIKTISIEIITDILKSENLI